MRYVCTICARGGSKGLPGKNLMELDGKPLIRLAVDQAKESGLFEWIAVSSDDPKILDASGADQLIHRPSELATDCAAKIPVIHHALLEVEKKKGQFDILVDLDATSPLRLSDDIIGAVDLLTKSNCKNVITGTASHRSPYFSMVEEYDDGRVAVVKTLPNAIIRRQDAPRTYDMNASVYVWNANIFRTTPQLFYDDTKLYEMPAERSWDIDSQLDFEINQFLLNTRK